MSSSSQPLTSTAEELYNLLRSLHDANEINNIDDVIPTSVSDAAHSIQGLYRYEVLDDNGLVYDSGDWKPNLILNVGLDKLAEMPIAQVFQFAVAGTDPTPTKESFEETNLSVKLLSSSKCNEAWKGGNECDKRNANSVLLARACPGNLRIAPDHAVGGTCEQKAFGVAHDSGKLLYLRDQDLQYNVLTSCPVYTQDPILPDIGFVADCSTTLSSAQIPGGAPVENPIPGTGLWVGRAGAGYVASLSHDTGLPWNEPGGLIIKRKNFPLPPGDCSVPVLCTYTVSANHTSFKDEWEILKGNYYLNPDMGISIEPPNILQPDIIATPQGCELTNSDITINDPGEGLPNGTGCVLKVNFNPSSNGTQCRSGEWNSQSPFSLSPPGICETAAGGARPNPRPIGDWAQGLWEGFNLLRYGSHQTGKFTHPDIVADLPSSFKSDNATSFEQFFSQLFMFTYFRPHITGIAPPYDTTRVNAWSEYQKNGVDYWQYQGYIPGFDPADPINSGRRWSDSKTGGNIGPGCGPDHTGIPLDNTNAGEDWRSQHYLPFWLSNNITTMDTSGGGGGGYVDKFGGAFGGSWATFKSDILDNTGPNTTSNDPARTGYLGNRFSGIPLGAFKDLPDYVWNITGEELDIGCGITDIENFGFFKGGSFLTGNNSNTYSGASNRNPNRLTDPHTVDSINLAHQFAIPNIVDGKLQSITFKWSEYYNAITDSNQHGHILGELNDRSIQLGWKFYPVVINRELPRGAVGEVTVDGATGSVTNINITDGGVGYCVGDTNIRGIIDLPTPRSATLSAATDAEGKISRIIVLDPGAGYSSTRPAKICFPPVPDPEIISYDLVISPVNTYESINNGHWHDNMALPTGCYKADIFNVNQTDLFNQYKTHGWYVTGNNVGTNTTHCGTDFLSAANQVAMTRTYDFYMELQPVTYAEIGFKESPAACELWSRIALDPPIKLCPGQFLRLAYQLVVTFEPGPVPRYKEIAGNKLWHNKVLPTGEYVLSGYECIQGTGIAVVDQFGIATPYDISGVANEPYAPGSTNLGPQYGFVNRWKNGDVRLSWPTKEYLTDNENPWLLGGDQVNPPDWAIKYKNNPTVNYMPRDFKSYLESPAVMGQIPNVNNPSATIQWLPLAVPAGPELTLERDSFDHWFTKAPPQAENSITFTNFVPNKLNGNGRWDFLITQGYVADIYPQLLAKPWVYHNVRDQEWIDRYKEGQLLPAGSPVARSNPGVFPGPVIPYTGQPGALHDPISVKGGRLTRNVEPIKWPYCDTYYIHLLEPNNTSGDLWAEIEWEIEYCKDKTKTWTSAEWCPTDYAPYANNVIDRTWGLTQRKNYYGFGSLINKNPVNEKAGGGFTQLESWAPWTHTPNITSIDQWSLVGEARGILKPDTAGNWTKSEAIPVAGASGFVSTSDEDFAKYGNWVNRSHTVFGAVSGENNRPVNDYTGDISVEVPTYLEPYTPNDHVVKKHAIFETSFANLTGIKCIGLGPTSTTIDPPYMTDAARFNSYVFKFGDVNTPDNYEGFDKLIAYKLDVTFSNTFYRNLKT